MFSTGGFIIFHWALWLSWWLGNHFRPPGLKQLNLVFDGLLSSVSMLLVKMPFWWSSLDVVKGTLEESIPELLWVDERAHKPPDERGEGGRNCGRKQESRKMKWRKKI